MRHTIAVGIVLASVVIALIGALLAGGQLAAIGSTRFRVAALLGIVLCCQVAGVLLGRLGFPAGPAYAAACLVSAVLLVLVARSDGGLPGAELVAIGLFLNALVMAANVNMPVSDYAAAQAGAPASVATDSRHEPATAVTSLRLLGEVIPVPLPLRPEVVSIGDLLIAAGLAQLAFGAVKPYGRRPRHVRSAKAPAKAPAVTASVVPPAKPAG